MKLDIYTQTGELRFSIEGSHEQSVRHRSLMNENYVQIVFTLDREIVFEAGDHLEYEGEVYTLAERYYPTRPDDLRYDYQLRFQGEEYIFKQIPLFNYVSGGSTEEKEPEFSFTGDLEHFITDVILPAIHKFTGDTTWEKGELESEATESLAFSGTFVWDALTDIANVFKVEWWLSGKKINFSKCEFGQVQTFSLGPDGGLSGMDFQETLSRIPNRIYAYGSARNITKRYNAEGTAYNKRLHLPSGVEYVELPGVTKVIPAVVFFDKEEAGNVYPRRTGIVSQVETGGTHNMPVYYFYDKDLDFNPQEQLIEGTSMMVHFESGSLMGRDFELAYDESKKRFEIINGQENDRQIPFGNIIPRTGDKYVLWNLEMPQSYITDAEKELQQVAQAYVEKINKQTPAVHCTSDPVYFHIYGKTVTVGSKVKILSSRFPQGYVQSRVTEFTYPLYNKSQITFTVADSIAGGRLAEIENKIKDVTGEAEFNKQFTQTVSRRSWRDAQELQSMLDSLAAEMILVGNPESQFASTCIFKSNKNNDPDLVAVSAGELQHKVYKGAADGKWNIEQAEFTLTENVPYYLYFQCSKTSNAGRMIISATRLALEGEPGYYQFLAGVVSSVFENARILHIVSGFTQIAGGNITTEKIQDPTGNLIIDLTSVPPKITTRNGAYFIGEFRFIDTEGKEQTIIEGSHIRTGLINADELRVQKVRAVKDNSIIEINPDSGLTLQSVIEGKPQITAQVEGTEYPSLNVDGLLGTGSAQNLPVISEFNSDATTVTIIDVPIIATAEAPVVIRIPGFKILYGIDYNARIEGTGTAAIGIKILLNGVIKAQCEFTFDNTNIEEQFEVNPNNPNEIISAGYYGVDVREILPVCGDVRYTANGTLNIQAQVTFTGNNSSYQKITTQMRFVGRSFGSYPLISQPIVVNGYSNVSKFFGNGVLFSQATNKYAALLSTPIDAILETRFENGGYRMSAVNGTQEWDPVKNMWVPLGTSGTGFRFSWSNISNKPLINGHSLAEGNNTLEALGIQTAGEYVIPADLLLYLKEGTFNTFVESDSVWKKDAEKNINDATQRIESLEDFFEIVDDNIHVKNNRGLYSDSFISARGMDGSSGGGGGLDTVSLWQELEGTVESKIIGISRLPAIPYNKLSGTPSKLSQFQNDAGYLTGITSSMVTTALGFTPVAPGALAGYLPLTGGTLTGGRPIYLDPSEGSITIQADTGGWDVGYGTMNSRQITLGRFAFIGDGNSLTYAYVGPSYQTPWMIINSAGNVGIGTTAPAARLDVNGSICSTGPLFTKARINIGNSAQSYRLTLQEEDNGIGVIYNQTYDGSAIADLQLGAVGSAAAANALTYNASTGRWGIGNSNPTAKLTINGAAHLAIGALSANPAAGQFSNTNTFSIIGDISNRYGLHAWVRSSGSAYLQVGRGDGNTSVYNLILQALGGNVGIGVESPAFRLDVAGDMRAYGGFIYSNSSGNTLRLGSANTDTIHIYKITGDATKFEMNLPLQTTGDIYAFRGYLRAASYSVETQIGAMSNDYTHYITTAPRNYFNKQVHVHGEIYAGSDYNQLVLHKGNYYDYAPTRYKFSTNANNSGKWYKIKINSAASWMLSFVLRVYQSYEATDIQISGYNYGTNYWYGPKARMIAAAGRDALEVKFGYDSAWNLWVAIPALQYTGIEISSVVQGYTYNVDTGNLFTITLEDTLTGTVQSSQITYRPLYLDDAAWGGTADNANRLGNIAAANYYHTGNANLSTVSWNAKVLRLGLGQMMCNESVGFYTTEGGEQKISVGGLLISNTYAADAAKVPSLGIYAKGTIQTNSAFVLPYAGTSWIGGALTDNSLRGSVKNSQSAFHPLIRLDAYSGGRVVYGGLGNSIGFYGYTAARIDAGWTDANNSTDWYTRWSVETGELTHSSNILLTSGYLSITRSGETVRIGNLNSSAGTVHIYTNSGNPVAFNCSIFSVNGDLGSGTYQWHNIYNDNTLHGRSINLRRSAYAGSGIQFYDASYNAWQIYMSPAGNTTSGWRGNITAPAGQLVTSWALRSFTESLSGYGWTWESGSTYSTTPVVVAELSQDGIFRTVKGIYSDGYVSAKGVDSSSDIRLKCNINPLGPVLEYIKRMNIFEHDWKSGGKSLGVSAQEERKKGRFGYLVHRKQDKTFTLEYAKYSMIALKGIQEILHKEDERDMKIAVLENHLKTARKKIKELENIVRRKGICR